MLTGPISAIAVSHAFSHASTSPPAAATARGASTGRPSWMRVCARPAARMGPTWLKLQADVIASSVSLEIM
jgi:hypothetical protein